MRPEPDVVLGDRYVLNRRIAIGGMGEVWEATDTLLDRRVAVKLLKEEFRAASTFLARFRAEARHAGQLSHPGIATVYDYGETSEVAFLVMELVDGQPLSELMASASSGQSELTPSTKLSILVQTAEALDAAHRAGVVHRDVKPGNLMIRHDGTVKVTDFGIARALTSAPLTEHGQMIGTPAYVSPEQAAGGTVTGASDIYSLGVVAYELFAGHPPFERDTPLGLTMAHVNDPPAPLPTTVPRGVALLIRSALAKDPSLRPPSARVLAQRLRREMAAMQSARTPSAPAGEGRKPSPTIVAPAASAPPAQRHSPQRASSIAVAVFVVLLVLAAATIWAVGRSGTSDDAGADPSVAVTVTAPAVAPTTPSPTAEPTQPPATEPPPTAPPTTAPPTTASPTTAPPTTAPPTTAPPTTAPPTTAPPPTQPAEPSSGVAPPAIATNAGGAVTATEAVEFVVDYYERVAAGEYATTWEALSPEFRDARNLTFERYVAYWENTNLELDNLRFVPGPGDGEGRVRFDARYDTGTRVVDETDEVTLRRDADGGLIISAQRIV